MSPRPLLPTSGCRSWENRGGTHRAACARYHRGWVGRGRCGEGGQGRSQLDGGASSWQVGPDAIRGGHEGRSGARGPRLRLLHIRVRDNASGSSCTSRNGTRGVPCSSTSTKAPSYKATRHGGPHLLYASKRGVAGPFGRAFRRRTMRQCCGLMTVENRAQ